jgi:hypothetical protein
VTPPGRTETCASSSLCVLEAKLATASTLESECINCDYMTDLDDIFFSECSTSCSNSFVDKSDERTRVHESSEMEGFDIDTDMRIADIGIGEKYRVEGLKAHSRESGSVDVAAPQQSPFPKNSRNCVLYCGRTEMREHGDLESRTNIPKHCGYRTKYRFFETGSMSTRLRRRSGQTKRSLN